MSIDRTMERSVVMEWSRFYLSASISSIMVKGGEGSTPGED